MIKPEALTRYTTWAKQKDLSPVTLETYIDRLRLFGLWFELTNGAPLGPADLTTEDVKQYRSHLLTRHKAPATINTSLAALASWADCYAIALGPVKKIKSQPAAPHWLDNKQQSALIRELEFRINGAPTDGIRWRAAAVKNITVLLLHTGLRVSELAALGPAAVEVSPRGGTLTVIGKGNKARRVPLNREARAALAALPLPIMIKVRGIERALQAAGARIGIRQLTPHTLRHTCAHNLALSNAPADQIAAILGHANLNTTRIYTQPGAGELAAAVELLE